MSAEQWVGVILLVIIVAALAGMAVTAHPRYPDSRLPVSMRRWCPVCHEFRTARMTAAGAVCTTCHPETPWRPVMRP